MKVNQLNCYILQSNEHIVFTFCIAMGIVESVGPEVKHIHVGDRVVVSAIIACGHCGCKVLILLTCI